MTSSTVEFEAPEYDAEGRVSPVRLSFTGSAETGWRVVRAGRVALELGPGYRLLRVAACGVCATDLARRHLPFPLPQVIGHEVLAHDERGRRWVIEINASCTARGVEPRCPTCRRGLDRHCPDRLVLGIDRLPGGFGPWILAPACAALPVPDAVDDDAAVLVEPFAAALNAVDSLRTPAPDAIAVLGPRRLGMLVLAALRARREEGAHGARILAVIRRPELAGLARRFGADEVLVSTARPHPVADVVIDTTGSPTGLETALGLAGREVHLKSTHGQRAGGLDRLTELVVDEITLVRFDPNAALATEGATPPIVGWCADSPPPAAWSGRAQVVRESDPGRLAERLAAREIGGALGRADLVVVDRAGQVDRVLRPVAGSAVSAVRPRGSILVARGDDDGEGTLVAAVRDRGLVVTSSRCGDFGIALDLLARSPSLASVGGDLITHRFGRADLGEALRVAASPGCVKALVAAEDTPGAPW